MKHVYYLFDVQRVVFSRKQRLLLNRSHKIKLSFIIKKGIGTVLHQSCTFLRVHVLHSKKLIKRFSYQNYQKNAINDHNGAFGKVKKIGVKVRFLKWRWPETTAVKLRSSVI